MDTVRDIARPGPAAQTIEAGLANTQASASTRPRIALLGLFGGRNLGNEASVDAMIETLRAAVPAAELSCICSVPESIVDRHGIDAMQLSPKGFRGFIPKALNRLLLRIPARIAQAGYAWTRLRDTDVVLVPGTGALDDFGFSPFTYPWDMFVWCLATRARGVKLVFASIGAGPIRHPLSRFFMKSAAAAAEYRSYRDQPSKDYMASIGIDTRHDPICPDLAFGLTHARSTREPGSDGLAVGVGVMTYYGWSADRQKNAEIYTRYIARITEFAAWLLAQGHSVHLLIGEDTDGQALSAVHEALTAGGAGGDGRIRAERARSLAELARQINDTDLVVATRFHNVVCALMCEKPTISLGYAAKNDALMAEMGLAEFCQHIETFDVEVLKRQFMTLQARRTEAAQAIRIKTEELQHRLEEQGKRIAAIAMSHLESRRERVGEPA